MQDLHRALGTLSETPDEDALMLARVKLHTLKGGAGLVGEEARDIQQIAHSAEDLFELIEDFQMRGAMSVVPREVLDGVLDAEDALQALVDILRMQGQSGRLSLTTKLLPIAPRDLVARLNDIAARVRVGDFGRPAEPEEPADHAVLAAPTERLGRGTGSLSTILTSPSSLLQPPHLTPFHLHTVAFQDILEQVERAEVRDAADVLTWAKRVENRAGAIAGSFTLYTCVQYLSSYEQERARYLTLAGEHGQLYVFGKPDVVPEPADRIVIVPLVAGDALCAERVVILDAEDAPAAFFAHIDRSEPTFAGQRYLSALVEDAVLVREATARLSATLDQDAAVLADRRAQLAPDPSRTAASSHPQPSPAPVQPSLVQRPPQPTQAYGKEYGVPAALDMLEDLSVKRDALQELMGRLLRQRIESRRSTRRLRTLVERVGSELADLRSELLRTTHHSGEWDLLEKEEYTTVTFCSCSLTRRSRIWKKVTIACGVTSARHRRNLRCKQTVNFVLSGRCSM